ncbi:MAG: agmatinase [Candidatus Jordarchaeaceae archaeon]
MSYKNLYLYPQNIFLGQTTSYEEADFALFGVPFDGTCTFLPGARFGPTVIREASCNLESFSLRSFRDAEDVKICDLGDVAVVPGDVNQTLDRVEKVVRELKQDGKKGIILGGEHTITLGAIRGFGRDVGVIDFDAHMDLRSEYLDQKISHATLMRRAVEEGVEILQIGVRSICKEEYEFISQKNCNYVTALEVEREGIKKAVDKIKEFQSRKDRIYLTIDMDVIDPAYAPDVGNPEPCGLTPTQLIDILENCDKVVGFDVVEVTHGGRITASVAAKIILELLCTIKVR